MERSDLTLSADLENERTRVDEALAHLDTVFKVQPAGLWTA